MARAELEHVDVGIAPFMVTVPDAVKVRTSRRSVVGSVTCWQPPFTHESPAAQGFPQRPQWAVATRRSASQPLVALPSQSAKPVAQRAMSQRPAAQAPVALAGAQRAPHVPQCARSLARVTSQPLVALPSQSPSPEAQVVAQRPWTHAAIAPGPAAQTVPHAPQFARSATVSRSQPLLGSPSQSRNVPVHCATAQRPAAQVAVALARAQRAPQRPQWAGSLAVSTSQPLVALPSQSSAPVSQRSPQSPAAQVALPRGPAAQDRPHAPQWAGVARVSTSHPLAGSLSQSPRPSSQTMTAHRPRRHTPVAAAGAQRAPHAPQWASVAVMSTQALSQQVSPAPQGRVPSQAGRHCPLTQRLPPVQCSSVRQATQR